MKLTKKQQIVQNLLKKHDIKKNEYYDIDTVVDILKKTSKTKFKKFESLDVSIRLGIDSTKSDQIIRSSSSLPHGNGKSIRVAVFADGTDRTDAIESGADKVGMQDLYDEIKSKVINYDLVIAKTDKMKFISDLGPILGPRGLMPNIKMGTLTSNIKKSVLHAKSGQINYKSEKNGIIHCSIGKIDFPIEKIRDNLEKLLSDLKKLKPVTSKGVFIKKIVLSTTMGPGISVKKESLNF